MEICEKNFKLLLASEDDVIRPWIARCTEGSAQILIPERLWLYFNSASVRRSPVCP